MSNFLSRFIIPILVSALFVCGSMWYVERNLNERLESEIADINQRFEAVNKELKNAMQAADSAIRAKNEIYALAAQRQIEIENNLKLFPDFDNVLIPDDLRLLLEGAKTDNSAVRSTTSTLGRYSDTVTK